MAENPIIRFENLSKTFGRGARQVHAVRELNLAIESGQVFGFLGPNGAGKSTTIRLMMDLIHPTAGTAFLFGQDVRRHPEVLRRVGSLVEGASFYGFLSGRQNLEVLARTADDVRPERREMLLEQVGLSPRADSLVNGYSTGMKQRLGIAAALLGDPDLVILDEPTNRLDPAGIQEMRAFIRELAEEGGKTVFVSSHLLHEVEQICDRVAILHHGRIVRHGAVADLLADGRTELRIQVHPLERAVQVLTERWPVEQDHDWLVIQARQDESPQVVRVLVGQDVQVYQVVAHRQSLEAFFMQVTQADVETDAVGTSDGDGPTPEGVLHV